MRVETVTAAGNASWVVGLVGAQSERFRRVTIAEADLAALTILDSELAFNGKGHLLRLGIQAYSLGIAYEFDPYISLSISRVDPLPHQLEAVYDHLLKLARVRFLLADDAGAGKTIMAGLLIKELKLRGMCERILIVAPSNLAFQWQCELKEKFDEKFFVIKGDDIRDQFGVNQWLEQKQLVTSLDLAKRTEILPGLRQVHWDLIIVDEAHRFRLFIASARGADEARCCYLRFLLVALGRLDSLDGGGVGPSLCLLDRDEFTGLGVAADLARFCPDMNALLTLRESEQTYTHLPILTLNQA